MATTSQSFPRLPADADAGARDSAGSRVAPLREIVPVGRANSVLDLVGNTPLLEITRLTAGLIPAGVRIFAKLEGFNPGGSVKDRPAKKMLEVGIAEGKLKPGKVILDSTSGNTGIALAMLGATLGYPVELVMPSNVSRERKKIVEAYGAKIHFSDPMEGSDGAIVMCRRLIERQPRALLQARPVQQRGQLAGAFRDHRPGNLAPDARPGDAFRRGDRHRRHRDGHRQVSQSRRTARSK